MDYAGMDIFMVYSLLHSIGIDNQLFLGKCQFLLVKGWVTLFPTFKNRAPKLTTFLAIASVSQIEVQW